MSSDLLHPLSLFRENSGESLPHHEVIDGTAMPEPYRSLLVHRGDMTSRLEAFHGRPIALEVLHCEHTMGAYRREVVLRLDGAGTPVEYGAIEIHLDAFQEELRDLIVQAHLPLGGLLNRFGVTYRSEPKAFLQLGPDHVLREHFAAPEAERFYGRCNVLVNAEDQVLARIVEVLHP